MFKLNKQRGESVKKSGAAANDLAKQFPKTPEEVVLVPEEQLKSNQGNYNLTYCFSTAVKPSGWCGTCDTKAKSVNEQIKPYFNTLMFISVMICIFRHDGTRQV